MDIKNTKQNYNKQIDLPRTIKFNAINETWHIIYVKSHKNKTITDSNSNICYLHISDNNYENKKRRLELWTKSFAKKILSTFINELSLFTKLPFQKLSIRGQKTLWGSCNSKRILV